MSYSKLFCFLILTVFLFSSIFTQPIMAQNGTITCESTRGRYNYCRVDTDNKVKLVRELSQTDCSQGSSWGYDKRGIWVDRGCRAEFEYGKGISGTGAAIGAGVAGGLILAAILASRKKDSEKYSDPDSVYNLGFSKGADDAKTNKTSDPRRYKDKYDSKFDSDFVRGYNEGYRNRGNNNQSSTSRAYSDGYQRGKDDATSNRRSDYLRYDNQFDSRTENDFRNGYDDGYKTSAEKSDERHDENSKVPSWMVGTYRGYISGSRQFRDMTIYADGRVWTRAADASSVSNGSYSNGYLFIGGTNYRVTKSGNGFFAQNLSNLSENTFYSRMY